MVSHRGKPMCSHILMDIKYKDDDADMWLY